MTDLYEYQLDGFLSLRDIIQQHQKINRKQGAQESSLTVIPSISSVTCKSIFLEQTRPTGEIIFHFTEVS